MSSDEREILLSIMDDIRAIMVNLRKINNINDFRKFVEEVKYLIEQVRIEIHMPKYKTLKPNILGEIRLVENEILYMHRCLLHGTIKTQPFENKLLDGLEKLQHSRNQLNDTLDVADSITENLVTQEERLININKNNKNVNDELKSSNSLIDRMRKWWR